VPPHVMRIYATMLPRIRAEEAMAALNLAYAGNERTMDDDQQARFSMALQHQAQGAERRRRPSLGQLEAMGIQVIRHGKDEFEKGGG